MQKLSNLNFSTEPAEIKQWVEARSGIPHRLRDRTGGAGGTLHVLFPETDETERKFYEPVSWEKFFALFEERGLAFCFQDEQESRYCRIQDLGSVGQVGQPHGRRHDERVGEQI